MYLKPKGISITTDGWGVPTKEDTFTCKHCQKVVFVPARTDPNEFWCACCMAPICKRCKKEDWDRPADKACFHFERRLAIAEAKGAFLAYLG
jgi:hypothetical protein